MKVMYICAKHPPYDGRIYYKISQVIQKCGHDVINLTPNTKDCLSSNGIRLVGFLQKQGIKERIKSLVSLYVTAKKQNADVLIAPEPDSLVIAYLIKCVQKETKVIFDCHEAYDLYFCGKFRFRWLERLLNSIVAFSMNFVSKRIEAVISVNDTMTQYFARVNPHSYCIPSLVDSDYRPNMEKIREGFIFFGQFGANKQETILLDAARELKNRGCSSKIIVVGGYNGSGFDKARKLFAQAIIDGGVENHLEYIQWLPREQAFEFLSSGIAGIMRFDSALFIDRPALPNKIWEYMASGMAIIADRKNRELQKIITEEKCGILVEDTGEALANAIIYLVEHKEEAKKMGENAYNSVQTTYNWEHYSALLDDILHIKNK